MQPTQLNLYFFLRRKIWLYPNALKKKNRAINWAIPVWIVWKFWVLLEKIWKLFLLVNQNDMLIWLLL